MTVAQANLARRLVEARGVSVTYQRLSRADDDAAKPWRGSADSRAIPEETTSVPTVFVPPGSASRLGLSTINQELVKKASQIAIVAPGPGFVPELEKFDTIVDPRDNTEYKISFVEALRPAAIDIVYFVGLEQ